MPPPDVPNREHLDALFRDDPFLATLGGELVSWDGGRATVRWVPGPEHGDGSGRVRAGALFSLADVALSVAGNSWGRFAVALTVESHFLSPVAVGAPLLAEARERSRARRTASYLIEVTGEADGDLVASAHASGYRTSRWLLGTDAWPEEWRETH